MTNLRSRLAKHLAVAAGVVATVSAVCDQPAQAAIVKWNVNQAIPATIDGLYVNVATQQTSSTPLPGWDINPYGNDGLAFFGTNAPAAPGEVYVRTQSDSGPSSLPLGFQIEATSPYTNNTGRVVNSSNNVFNGWQLNSLNYFGFRFNPGTIAGEVRYAWGSVQMGNSWNSRTLVDIAYNDVGDPIKVGQVPGPLPIVGAGAAFAWSRRLRRRLAQRP
jgi:hypothetical protein